MMCNVGAAAHWDHADPGWRKVRGRFRTKESIKDFKSLQFAVEDAVSSLILSEIIGRESGTQQIAYYEDRVFQDYSFRNYMESFGAIKPIIRPEDLLKKGMLDIGKYVFFDHYKICGMVNEHKHYLQEWAAIHKLYFFRKLLAKHDFDQWERWLSEAKCTGEVWFRLHSHYLEQAYERNQSLLDDLKENAGAKSDQASDRQTYQALSTKLMEEIDKEYLRELNEKFIKMENYRGDYTRFKAILKYRLLEARTAKFQAKKIQLLPKNYQPTPKLPLQSVYRSLPVQVASLFKIQAGGKYPRAGLLMVGTAALSALGFATRPDLKKV